MAGLAASIRLAKAGYKVQILEANDYTGGSMHEIKMNGFRFDAGPSILTKPDYIDELFALWNKRTSDYLKFKKVDPLFRYFFSDGTFIDAFSDRDKFEKEIALKSSESFAHIHKLLDDSKEIFNLTHEVFLERSLHELKNYFNWPTIRGLVKFNRVRAFQSMHSYNQNKFNDKRLVQLFNRYASYNGSNPFEAPATLNVITHFAVNEGSFLPEGGMHSITNALTQLAIESGVQIKLKTPVKKIVTKNNKAIGVETESGLLLSDVVVSNADINFTYSKLLDGVKMPAMYSSAKHRSSSVIVFYWGINKVLPNIELHNTFFGADDHAEYDALFKQQTICNDPTVYLFNSSLSNPTDAPAGMSNWFVMVSAPFDDGQNWEQLISATRKKVLDKLSSKLNEDISGLIVSEQILSPPQLADKTNLWCGSIYGNNSNGLFSAFLRHPNFSRKIKGLYFCGGSVHPGAGIPLCLLSAKIVSEMIKKKEGTFPVNTSEKEAQSKSLRYTLDTAVEQ